MENVISEKLPTWQPQELIDIGNGCQCGITTDDGCYIVLIRGYGNGWQPTRWIPLEVAKRLGEMATAYCKEFV